MIPFRFISKSGSIAGLFLILTCLAPSALAGTAYFQSDAEILTEADYQTLSTANAESYTIGRGDTLFIELEDPFAASSADDLLTLYYTNNDRRRQQFGINFGYEQNGVIEWAFANPTFFDVRGSGSVSLFGFSNFCSVAGGCTFISLTGGNGNGGRGFNLDAVAVNGEFLSAAAPTPEPSLWALMITGFMFVGWRLKQTKSDMSALQPTS